MSDKPRKPGPGSPPRESAAAHWYDLFSRGARDWLRHNDKVRDAVRNKLPEIISGADVSGGNADRTVKVPVKFMEHARFRLRPDPQPEGVGQGDVKPGDRLRQPRKGQGDGQGEGSGEGGGVEFVLEFKIDDIVEWLWEELELPDLKDKTGGMEDDDYVREGWDKRGVRSRLDRRRSMKEAIKRRRIQGPDAPSITNEDLRFRQLALRRRPANEAVVFFAMDVSASMTEKDRQLAKTFFFWAVQGLRRQYAQLTPVFIAHTIEAWTFDEDEFFQVRGTGGTVASSAFRKAQELIQSDYDPGRYNLYMFYASDGENFPEDRQPAAESLAELARVLNFCAFAEVSQGRGTPLKTQTAAIFEDLISHGAPVDCFALNGADAVWDAIRRFFRRQAAVVGNQEASP